MGRPRRHLRKNWPRGLTERRSGNTIYYTYRGPAGTKEIYLSTNLAAAKEAVAIVNAKRAPDPVQKVINRIERPTAILNDHLDWFDTNIVTGMGSEQTRYEFRRKFKHVRAAFGSKPLPDIDRAAIAGFLEQFPGRSSNQYRQALNQVFTHAVARGLRADNPVQGTIARKVKVQRTRLTMGGFDAIYANAQPWFKRAMDLALWSLQRREDLIDIRVDDFADDRVSVKQKKVEAHGTGRIRIKPGPNLLAAIRACLNSPDLKEKGMGDCRFLLHRIPEKRRKAKGREHFGQLSEEMATRAFQEIRDSLPTFQAMPEPTRPTFHEIRALGADHYKHKLGWTDAQVQALLGHSDVGMTMVYLGRHGERWQEVDSG